MRAKLGSIYQRRKKLPDGTTVMLSPWWIKYTRNGQVFRESSGWDKYADAERLLKRRLGEIATGKFAGPGARENHRQPTTRRSPCRLPAPRAPQPAHDREAGEQEPLARLWLYSRR